MSKTKNIAALIISFLASIAILFGIDSFSKYLLMSFPLTARMVLMIVTYWSVAAVSAAALLFCGHKLADYGCTKEKLPAQIGTGVALGAAMSLVLTVIPHLTGFGGYVSSDKLYTHLWQFIYEFVYCIIAIGLVEELVFRGTIYEYAK
ncbi:MAG: CPBP family intramembrane metalloprotease, partial [Ruminococcus sp.]|nr:CPBP family intramembrane metalloprotease [Ruminococcus sp.]